MRQGIVIKIYVYFFMGGNWGLMHYGNAQYASDIL